MTTMTRPQPGHTEVDHSSWELVARAQDGDMSAYGELYTRYYPKVMGFLWARLTDRDLCEDLAAETFFRALRRIDSVSYQGLDVGAWFTVIARNIMMDHRKSSQVRLERPLDDSPVLEFADRDRHVDPEREAVNTTLRGLLEVALGRLCTPGQAAVLSLRFLDGLSVADTAAVLNRSEGATKSLQSRASQGMRQLLPPSVVDYLT